jgi:hypothetical protein
MKSEKNISVKQNVKRVAQSKYGTTSDFLGMGWVLG